MSLSKESPVISEPVKELSKREELQHKLNAILEECGWQESNIPIVSEYWSLRNQLLSMK